MPVIGQPISGSSRFPIGTHTVVSMYSGEHGSKSYLHAYPVDAESSSCGRFTLIKGNPPRHPQTFLPNKFDWTIGGTPPTS